MTLAASLILNVSVLFCFVFVFVFFLLFFILCSIICMMFPCCIQCLYFIKDMFQCFVF